MSSGVNCCNSCPTVQTVNVPGVQGATGATGADGTPATILPEQSFYVVGSSQALTAANVQLIGANLTLPTDSTYLLSAGVRIDYSGATTTTSRTIYLRLYRTNNGAAAVANTEHELSTGLVTLDDSTLCSTTFPTVVYTGTAGDIIHIQGSLSVALAAPYDPYEAGSIIAVEAWMLALPIT